MDRVYCGGDLAFGPRIVIEAEADGKRAALAIHEALGGGAVPRAHARFRPVELNRAGDHYDRVPRQAVPALPVARRTGFREVEEGYSEEQARLEASRCLRCNVETIFDSERCILCSGCVEICPEACLALVPGSNLRTQPDIIALSEALDAGEDAGAIIKDEARCIRCGLCAERCPTGAITMESLEIDESPQTALGLYHEGMREVRT
jgi:NAD-dependent dihydropyrimidine dehydrogenase PreA subunit